MYLKSLRLEGSSTSKPFKFGCNFFFGDVDRDRKRLNNNGQECKIVTSIWESAITIDESATLGKLLDMLQSPDSHAELNLLELNMSEATARKLWKHLRDGDIEKEKFFYFKENGDSVRNYSIGKNVHSY